MRSITFIIIHRYWTDYDLAMRRREEHGIHRHWWYHASMLLVLLYGKHLKYASILICILLWITTADELQPATTGGMDGAVDSVNYTDKDKNCDTVCCLLSGSKTRSISFTNEVRHSCGSIHTSRADAEERQSLNISLVSDWIVRGQSAQTLPRNIVAPWQMLPFLVSGALGHTQ